MSDPICAKKDAYVEDLTAGDYWWCSCGQSKTQPFCDGSHKYTDFNPVKFTIKENGTHYLCGCKHTATPPFCDGSHKKL